ncbi:GD19516 [Drosophila simulans]|uniref:GD19516 n=1 Tax=Drosophila simulans TaxID=7240 RepID=B4QYY0_DROSI|nr:GD19516 [Drosophila simulans]
MAPPEHHHDAMPMAAIRTILKAYPWHSGSGLSSSFPFRQGRAICEFPTISIYLLAINTARIKDSAAATERIIRQPTMLRGQRITLRSLWLRLVEGIEMQTKESSAPEGFEEAVPAG